MHRNNLFLEKQTRKKKTRECDSEKNRRDFLISVIEIVLFSGYACAKAASYLARLYIKAATCWTTCIPPILLNRGYIYFSGPHIPSFVSFKKCSRRHLSGKFVFSTLFPSHRFLLLPVHPVRLWNFPTGKNLLQITLQNFYFLGNFFLLKNNF